VDYPAATVEQLGAEKILANVLEGVKTSGATLLQENELDFPNSVGRELFYVKDGPFAIQSRLLLVENRFYQLTVARSGEAPDPDARRFFESFRLSP
jgi:hypothetical protein